MAATQEQIGRSLRPMNNRRLPTPYSHGHARAVVQLRQQRTCTVELCSSVSASKSSLTFRSCSDRSLASRSNWPCSDMSRRTGCAHAARSQLRWRRAHLLLQVAVQRLGQRLVFLMRLLELRRSVLGQFCSVRQRVHAYARMHACTARPLAFLLSGMHAEPRRYDPHRLYLAGSAACASTPCLCPVRSAPSW